MLSSGAVWNFCTQAAPGQMSDTKHSTSAPPLSPMDPEEPNEGSSGGGGFPFLFGVYTLLYGLLIFYYLLWAGAVRGRYLVGKLVRGYLRRRWHDELLDFNIGSLGFAVLSGQIFINNLDFRCSDYYLRVVQATIGWTWWYKQVAQPDNFVDASLPFRLSIGIRGCEVVVFNNTAAYRKLAGLIDPSAEGREPETSETPLSSEGRENSECSSAASSESPLPGFHRWFPVTSINLEHTALVLGSLETPHLLVISCQSADIVHTTAPPQTPGAGVYSLLTRANRIRDLRCFTTPNQSYIDADELVRKSQELQESDLLAHMVQNVAAGMQRIWDRREGQHISSDPHQQSLEMPSLHSPRMSAELPASSGIPESGGSVVVDAEESIFHCSLVAMEFQSDVGASATSAFLEAWTEAAREAVSPPGTEAGPSPHLMKAQTSGRRAQMLPKSRLELILLSGAFIHFGPLIYKQQNLLGHILTPLDFQNQEVYRPRLGEVLQSSHLHVAARFQTGGVFAMSFRELSRFFSDPRFQTDDDYLRRELIQKGLDSYPANANLTVNLDAQSRCSLSIQNLSLEEGSGSKTELDFAVHNASFITSNTGASLLESEIFEYGMRIHYPEAWNGVSLYEMDFKALRPRVFLLADHNRFFADFIRDWSQRGEESYQHLWWWDELEYFFPSKSRYRFQLSDARLYFNANENNICDSINDLSANTHVCLHTNQLLVGVDFSSLEFRPQSSRVSWWAETSDAHAHLLLPEQHPISHLVGSATAVEGRSGDASESGADQIFFTEKLEIRGRYEGHYDPDPSVRDSHAMDVVLEGVECRLFGHYLRALDNVRRNYFGQTRSVISSADFRLASHRNTISQDWERTSVDLPPESGVTGNTWDTILTLHMNKMSFVLPKQLWNMRRAQGPQIRLWELELEYRWIDQFAQYSLHTSPITLVVPQHPGTDLGGQPSEIRSPFARFYPGRRRKQEQHGDPSRQQGLTGQHSRPRAGSYRAVWTESDTFLTLEHISLNWHLCQGPAPGYPIYQDSMKMSIGAVQGQLFVEQLQSLIRAGSNLLEQYAEAQDHALPVPVQVPVHQVWVSQISHSRPNAPKAEHPEEERESESAFVLFCQSDSIHHLPDLVEVSYQSPRHQIVHREVFRISPARGFGFKIALDPRVSSPVRSYLKTLSSGDSISISSPGIIADADYNIPESLRNVSVCSVSFNLILSGPARAQARRNSHPSSGRDGPASRDPSAAETPSPGAQVPSVLELMIPSGFQYRGSSVITEESALRRSLQAPLLTVSLLVPRVTDSRHRSLQWLALLDASAQVDLTLSHQRTDWKEAQARQQDFMYSNLPVVHGGVEPRAPRAGLAPHAQVSWQRMNCIKMNQTKLDPETAKTAIAQGIMMSSVGADGEIAFSGAGSAPLAVPLESTSPSIFSDNGSLPVTRDNHRFFHAASHPDYSAGMVWEELHGLEPTSLSDAPDLSVASFHSMEELDTGSDQNHSYHSWESQSQDSVDTSLHPPAPSSSETAAAAFDPTHLNGDLGAQDSAVAHHCSLRRAWIYSTTADRRKPSGPSSSQHTANHALPESNLAGTTAGAFMPLSFSVFGASETGSRAEEPLTEDPSRLFCYLRTQQTLQRRPSPRSSHETVPGDPSASRSLPQEPQLGSSVIPRPVRVETREFDLTSVSIIASPFACQYLDSLLPLLKPSYRSLEDSIDDLCIHINRVFDRSRSSPSTLRLAKLVGGFGVLDTPEFASFAYGLSMDPGSLALPASEVRSVVRLQDVQLALLHPLSDPPQNPRRSVPPSRRGASDLMVLLQWQSLTLWHCCSHPPNSCPGGPLTAWLRLDTQPLHTASLEVLDLDLSTHTRSGPAPWKVSARCYSDRLTGLYRWSLPQSTLCRVVQKARIHAECIACWLSPETPEFLLQLHSFWTGEIISSLEFLHHLRSKVRIAQCVASGRGALAHGSTEQPEESLDRSFGPVLQGGPSSMSESHRWALIIAYAFQHVRRSQAVVEGPWNKGRLTSQDQLNLADWIDLRTDHNPILRITPSGFVLRSRIFGDSSVLSRNSHASVYSRASPLILAFRKLLNLPDNLLKALHLQLQREDRGFAARMQLPQTAEGFSNILAGIEPGAYDNAASDPELIAAPSLQDLLKDMARLIPEAAGLVPITADSRFSLSPLPWDHLRSQRALYRRLASQYSDMDFECLVQQSFLGWESKASSEQPILEQIRDWPQSITIQSVLLCSSARFDKSREQSSVAPIASGAMSRNGDETASAGLTTLRTRNSAASPRFVEASSLPRKGRDRSLPPLPSGAAGRNSNTRHSPDRGFQIPRKPVSNHPLSLSTSSSEEEVKSEVLPPVPLAMVSPGAAGQSHPLVTRPASRPDPSPESTKGFHDPLFSGSEDDHQEMELQERIPLPRPSSEDPYLADIARQPDRKSLTAFRDQKLQKSLPPQGVGSSSSPKDQSSRTQTSLIQCGIMDIQITPEMVKILESLLPLFAQPDVRPSPPPVAQPSVLSHHQVDYHVALLKVRVSLRTPGIGHLQSTLRSLRFSSGSRSAAPESALGSDVLASPAGLNEFWFANARLEQCETQLIQIRASSQRTRVETGFDPVTLLSARVSQLTMNFTAATAPWKSGPSGRKRAALLDCAEIALNVPAKAIECGDLKPLYDPWITVWRTVRRAADVTARAPVTRSRLSLEESVKRRVSISAPTERKDPKGLDPATMQEPTRELFNLWKLPPTANPLTEQLGRRPLPLPPTSSAADVDVGFAPWTVLAKFYTFKVSVAPAPGVDFSYQLDHLSLQSQGISPEHLGLTVSLARPADHLMSTVATGRHHTGLGQTQQTRTHRRHPTRIPQHRETGRRQPRTFTFPAAEHPLQDVFEMEDDPCSESVPSPHPPPPSAPATASTGNNRTTREASGRAGSKAPVHCITFSSLSGGDDGEQDSMHLQFDLPVIVAELTRTRQSLPIPSLPRSGDGQPSRSEAFSHVEGRVSISEMTNRFDEDILGKLLQVQDHLLQLASAYSDLGTVSSDLSAASPDKQGAARGTSRRSESMRFDAVAVSLEIVLEGVELLAELKVPQHQGGASESRPGHPKNAPAAASGGPGDARDSDVLAQEVAEMCRAFVRANHQPSFRLTTGGFSTSLRWISDGLADQMESEGLMAEFTETLESPVLHPPGVAPAIQNPHLQKRDKILKQIAVSRLSLRFDLRGLGCFLSIPKPPDRVAAAELTGILPPEFMVFLDARQSMLGVYSAPTSRMIPRFMAPTTEADVVAVRNLLRPRRQVLLQVTSAASFAVGLDQQLKEVSMDLSVSRSTVKVRGTSLTTSSTQLLLARYTQAYEDYHIERKQLLEAFDPSFPLREPPESPIHSFRKQFSAQISSTSSPTVQKTQSFIKGAMGSRPGAPGASPPLQMQDWYIVSSAAITHSVLLVLLERQPGDQLPPAATTRSHLPRNMVDGMGAGSGAQLQTQDLTTFLCTLRRGSGVFQIRPAPALSGETSSRWEIQNQTLVEGLRMGFSPKPCDPSVLTDFMRVQTANYVRSRDRVQVDRLETPEPEPFASPAHVFWPWKKQIVNHLFLSQCRVTIQASTSCPASLSRLEIQLQSGGPQLILDPHLIRHIQDLGAVLQVLSSSNPDPEVDSGPSGGQEIDPKEQECSDRRFRLPAVQFRMGVSRGEIDFRGPHPVTSSIPDHRPSRHRRRPTRDHVDGLRSPGSSSSPAGGSTPPSVPTLDEKADPLIGPSLLILPSPAVSVAYAYLGMGSDEPDPAILDSTPEHVVRIRVSPQSLVIKPNFLIFVRGVWDGLRAGESGSPVRPISSSQPHPTTLFTEVPETELEFPRSGNPLVFLLLQVMPFFVSVDTDVLSPTHSAQSSASPRGESPGSHHRRRPSIFEPHARQTQSPTPHASLGLVLSQPLTAVYSRTLNAQGSVSEILTSFTVQLGRPPGQAPPLRRLRRRHEALSTAPLKIFLGLRGEEDSLQVDPSRVLCSAEVMNSSLHVGECTGFGSAVRSTLLRVRGIKVHCDPHSAESWFWFQRLWVDPFAELVTEGNQEPRLSAAGAPQGLKPANGPSSEPTQTRSQIPKPALSVIAAVDSVQAHLDLEREESIGSVIKLTSQPLSAQLLDFGPNSVEFDGLLPLFHSFAIKSCPQTSPFAPDFTQPQEQIKIPEWIHNCRPLSVLLSCRGFELTSDPAVSGLEANLHSQGFQAHLIARPLHPGVVYNATEFRCVPDSASPDDPLGFGGVASSQSVDQIMHQGVRLLRRGPHSSPGKRHILFRPLPSGLLAGKSTLNRFDISVQPIFCTLDYRGSQYNNARLLQFGLYSGPSRTPFHVSLVDVYPGAAFDTGSATKVPTSMTLVRGSDPDRFARLPKSSGHHIAHHFAHSTEARADVGWTTALQVDLGNLEIGTSGYTAPYFMEQASRIMDIIEDCRVSVCSVLPARAIPSLGFSFSPPASPRSHLLPTDLLFPTSIRHPPPGPPVTVERDAQETLSGSQGRVTVRCGFLRMDLLEDHGLDSVAVLLWDLDIAGVKTKRSLLRSRSSNLSHSPSSNADGWDPILTDQDQTDPGSSPEEQRLNDVEVRRLISVHIGQPRRSPRGPESRRRDSQGSSEKHQQGSDRPKGSEGLLVGRVVASTNSLCPVVGVPCVVLEQETMETIDHFHSSASGDSSGLGGREQRQHSPRSHQLSSLRLLDDPHRPLVPPSPALVRSRSIRQQQLEQRRAHHRILLRQSGRRPRQVQARLQFVWDSGISVTTDVLEFQHLARLMNLYTNRVLLSKDQLLSEQKKRWRVWASMIDHQVRQSFPDPSSPRDDSTSTPYHAPRGSRSPSLSLQGSSPARRWEAEEQDFLRSRRRSLAKDLGMSLAELLPKESGFAAWYLGHMFNLSPAEAEKQVDLWRAIHRPSSSRLSSHPHRGDKYIITCTPPDFRPGDPAVGVFNNALSNVPVSFLTHILDMFLPYADGRKSAPLPNPSDGVSASSQTASRISGQHPSVVQRTGVPAVSSDPEGLGVLRQQRKIQQRLGLPSPESVSAQGDESRDSVDQEVSSSKGKKVVSRTARRLLPSYLYELMLRLDAIVSTGDSLSHSIDSLMYR